MKSASLLKHLNAYSLSLIIISFLAFHANTAGAFRPFEYSKLSLWWPVSAWRMTYTTNPPLHLPNRFTIRRFETMYSDDVAVPLYESNNDCTEAVPCPTEEITEANLTSILSKMRTYWPYVFFDDNMTANIIYWKEMWEFGKCYLYPHDPLYYFGEALKVAERYDILNILYDNKPTLIFPSVFLRYHPNDIFEAIKKVLGVIVEVKCSNIVDGVDGDQQDLEEVHICQSPDGTLIDCKEKLINCPDNERIEFPVARIPYYYRDNEKE